MEFSFSTLFWVPLLLGTMVLGLNLSRSIRITQLCRDAGHMYAYGVDFSQTGNQNLLLQLATGLNITANAGNGVIIFSTVTYIAANDCTAGGLQANSSQCPNLNYQVFTKRIVVGNAALQSSAFGTPRSSDMDSTGSIASSSFLTDSTTRALGFSNLLALTSGQYAYVSETYFSSPDYDWHGFLTGTGVAADRSFDMRASPSKQKGAALIMFTVMLVLVVTPMVGLAIDGAILYLIQARLSAAADAAALSGARSLSTGLDIPSQTASAQATAQAYFTANFPSGVLRTSNVIFNASVAQTALKVRTVSVQVTVTAPLYFMRILNHATGTVVASSQASRRDVNMMLVLDRSGSMQQAGVCGTMIASAQNFVNRFSNGRDTVGLITFNGGSSLDYAPTVNFLSNSPSLPTQIGNIQCAGATGSAQALWQAYQQILAVNQPGALNLIVFFTDGVANAITAAYPKKTQADTRYDYNNTSSLVTVPASSCTGTIPLTGYITQLSYFTELGSTGGVFNPVAPSITSDSINLISAPGCAFPQSLPYGLPMRQDVAYIPSTDVYGNLTNGYESLHPDDYFPSGPYAGQIRVDNPNAIQHAGANAADSAASRIRADTNFTPVIYSIGLGGTGAASGPVDPVFLNRVANTPQSAIYNSAQPSGIYAYAPTAAQLASAFEIIASQILRLAQ